MPVAAPSQNEPQVTHFRHILPKPPGCHSGQLSPNSALSNQSNSQSARYQPHLGQDLSPGVVPQEAAAAQINNNLISMQENQGHFFSTHSPPILNLSPNLSPTEPQRSSPFYDLRETTRRRSLQGMCSFCTLSCLEVFVSGNSHLCCLEMLKQTGPNNTVSMATLYLSLNARFRESLHCICEHRLSEIIFP